MSTAEQSSPAHLVRAKPVDIALLGCQYLVSLDDPELY